MHLDTIPCILTVGKMLSLIIVDDEFEIRNGLKNYCPWDDFGISLLEVFDNGTDALKFIMGNNVDIVLTDIKMPGMDGLEFVERTLEKKPKTKFVIISGFKNFEYAKKCMSFGIRDYLLKPTKFAELKQVFLRIVGEINEDKSFDGNSLIERVKKYVTSNIKEASLEKAASHVRLNPYYLSTLFHQETGVKFFDYLFKTKMTKAQQLLANSTLSIKEISNSIGYTNSTSFSRAFKLYTGTNPNEFRNTLKR